MSSKYDELSRTKYCAMLCLGRKAYTKRELFDKLLKKEYSEECCEQTIEYLENEGYINDSDYAARYTNDAINLKKHGSVRIKADLRRKGIDAEIIDRLFEELESPDVETIKTVIEKKAEKLDLSDKKQRDRLIGYLLRRGFRYGEIYSELRNAELIMYNEEMLDE